MTTNLNEMAVQLTEAEGLAQQLNVTQIKEVIALLGIRWRGMAHDDFLDEVMAIRHKGGVGSAHNN